MLNIRRISQRALQVRAWQQCYQPDLETVSPRQGERYFQLTLISHTEKVPALVNVERWCHHHWPAFTHYAWNSIDEDNLISLFTTENRGMRFFSEHFRCGSLEIIDDSPAKPWLCVQEPALGQVLLPSPIEGLAKQSKQQLALHKLKLQADWVLGYSYISAKLLQSIQLHDVFCIQQLLLNMSIAGRPFARFQKQQEGQFMIEETIAPIADESALLQEETFSDEVVKPFDVNAMTIKLTFVLGQTEITLNELADIQPGAVYSIGENKEREVKVYANKQLIAEGELIYIGESDELGLEITRLAHLGDKRP